jgi:hypothetical protein
MARVRWAACSACTLYIAFFVAGVAAQDVPIADPGSLAFEQGRWEDVIVEYRAILDASPEDRLSLLRIAQAERELGRHQAALATLEQARAANAPEAMIDLERARNLLALGQTEFALGALETADHVGLRALGLLEDAADFDPLRKEPRFQQVYRSVRGRVFPCEGMPAAHEFDFWLGRWEVRMPDGTLLGYDTITKRDGGCTVHEAWEGSGGSSGTSLLFYVPSREQWRQVWVGSGATLIDITGGSTDEGQMHLEGTVEYAAEDRVVAFRGTWTVAPDGRVRQRMEEFDLLGQNWALWFDGFFRRVE